jgi:hypothetical protein
MGTSLSYLLLVWGLVTAVLVALLAYRGLLQAREDDQIFINKAEDHIAAEQRDIIAKVTRLGRPIMTLSVASGVLLLVCAGVWVWGGFTQQQ